MLIYIDKEFAIEFEKRLLEGNHFQSPNQFKVNSRLFELFREYTELEVYSDVCQEEKFNIRLFKYIFDLNAFIGSVDEFTSQLTNIQKHTHALAFTSKRYEWASLFEESGGLYFTSEDYQQKIFRILGYEKSIRFIDLKQPFSWNDISYISLLPADKAFLTDNYVITSEKKIRKNLVPLMKILNRIEPCNLSLQLFVNKDKFNWNDQDWEDFEIEMNDLIVKEDLAIELKVATYSSKKGQKRYDFHDRKLFLKYIKVEVGKGFDLLPYDQNTISDKKVVVETIFSKDAYDDFRNYYLKICRD
jgi:hypothetical protein